MNHLAAAILALSVLGTTAAGLPRYSLQMRTDQAVPRSEYLAVSAQDVARAYHLDPYLVITVAWYETAFDRDRVSSKGARSIMQLLGRLGDRYDAGCKAVGHPWACDYVALVIGAAELSHGLAVCGDEAGALSWYMAGRCDLRDDWRVLQRLATRDELRWGEP